jgi:hypothetical protein
MRRQVPSPLRRGLSPRVAAETVSVDDGASPAHRRAHSPVRRRRLSPRSSPRSGSLVGRSSSRSPLRRLSPARSPRTRMSYSPVVMGQHGDEVMVAADDDAYNTDNVWVQEWSEEHGLFYCACSPPFPSVPTGRPSLALSPPLSRLPGSWLAAGWHVDTRATSWVKPTAGGVVAGNYQQPLSGPTNHRSR